MILELAEAHSVANADHRQTLPFRVGGASPEAKTGAKAHIWPNVQDIMSRVLVKRRLSLLDAPCEIARSLVSRAPGSSVRVTFEGTQASWS